MCVDVLLPAAIASCQQSQLVFFQEVMSQRVNRPSASSSSSNTPKVTVDR